MTSSVCNPLVLIEVHESTLIVNCAAAIGAEPTPDLFVAGPTVRPFLTMYFFFEGEELRSSPACTAGTTRSELLRNIFRLFTLRLK
jgi:hypothetical protein